MARANLCASAICAGVIFCGDPIAIVLDAAHGDGRSRGAALKHLGAAPRAMALVSPFMHIRAYILSGPSRRLRQIHGRIAILRPVGSGWLQRYASETVLCFLSAGRLCARNTRPVNLGLNPYKQAIFLHWRVIKNLLVQYWQ
jgi:hypothetical protein